MIPTKLREGKIEDQAPMRFTLLLVGAGVGLLAWMVAMGVNPYLVASDIGTGHPSDSLMGELLGWHVLGKGGEWRHGTAELPVQVCVAYFAFLFLLMRWWKQAEFIRESRISLWSIFMSGFLGYLLHFIWFFPQPAGLLVAGLTSFTVQFASPWMAPSQRQAIGDVGI
jgi:hypothetical protein